MQAMKKNNPKAVWVAQAWQANPRPQMIGNLEAGDLIVLDLFAESRPQWGDPASTWYRKDGFGQHDWIYCMLLNYGGNVGLHGKMKHGSHCSDHNSLSSPTSLKPDTDVR
jgi:alpha-N-acetylglucosaminidase